MNTIRTAICDDNKDIITALAGAASSVLQQKGFMPEIFRFLNGQELIARMKSLPPFQLILLDIDMPGLDGIHVGKMIREISPDVPIIYVSECENRVFDTYSVQPLCFVRKSHFLTDMSTAAELFARQYQKNEKTFVELSARGGMLTVNYKEIVYFEGQKNYQILHMKTGGRTEELKMTMENLENLLGDKGFLRVHKGFLVNYLYIRRIDSLQLLLTDGTQIPIGRSRLESVKRQYVQLMDPGEMSVCP